MIARALLVENVCQPEFLAQPETNIMLLFNKSLLQTKYLNLKRVSAFYDSKLLSHSARYIRIEFQICHLFQRPEFPKSR